MYDTHICMKYVIYFFCTLLSFYNMLIVQKAKKTFLSILTATHHSRYSLIIIIGDFGKIYLKTSCLPLLDKSSVL